MPFQSVEEIEKSYAEAFKRAKGRPEVEAEIKVEQAQALADFRLRSVAERERKLWLREALSDYPLAEEFPDLVQGDSEGALRMSAEALHNRLLKRFETHQQKQRIDEIVKAHLEGDNQNKPEGDPNADPVA
jgi:hypothetical protein